MTVQINLLQNQKDYNKLDNAFRVGRIAIVILGVMCLVTLAVVFGLKRNAQAELDEAVSQLDALQQEINALQEAEARIILINEKMNAMNTIIAEQPDYSRNLETFLAFLPQGAEIQRITLENNRADVVLSFQGILPLSSYIAILESEDFQQYCTSVKMEGIQVVDFNEPLTFAINVTY